MYHFWQATVHLCWIFRETLWNYTTVTSLLLILIWFSPHVSRACTIWDCRLAKAKMFVNLQKTLYAVNRWVCQLMYPKTTTYASMNFPIMSVRTLSIPVRGSQDFIPLEVCYIMTRITGFVTLRSGNFITFLFTYFFYDHEQRLSCLKVFSQWTLTLWSFSHPFPDFVDALCKKDWHLKLFLGLVYLR